MKRRFMNIFILILFVFSMPSHVFAEDNKSFLGIKDLLTQKGLKTVEELTSQSKKSTQTWCADMPAQVLENILEVLVRNKEYDSLSAFLSTCTKFNYLKEGTPREDSTWNINDKLKKKIKKGFKYLDEVSAILDNIAKQTGQAEFFNTHHRKDFTKIPLYILEKIVTTELLKDALAEKSSYWEFLLSLKKLNPSETSTVRFNDKELKLIPSYISNFTALEKLDLSVNKLVILPDAVLNLPVLKELNINNNHILFIQPEISKMKKLRIMRFAYNKFSKLPIEFGELWDVEKIEIDPKLYRHEAIAEQIQIIKDRRAPIMEAKFELILSSEFKKFLQE